jgi:hypothetical protein
MDFMEDIKNVYPNVYVRQIKKAGNDFVEEVLKQGDDIYKKMDIENDEEHRAFLYQLDNMGLAFRNWLKE